MKPREKNKKGKRVYYRAVKVLSKPIKIKFYTKEGKEVIFEGIRTYTKKIKEKMG